MVKGAWWSLEDWGYFERYISKAKMMKLKSSYLLAGVVALAVTGWMLSDNFVNKFQDKNPALIKLADIKITDEKMSGAPQLGFKVSAVQVKNEPVKRVIRASGVSEASFEMTVSSTASGQIVTVGAIEGNKVKTGDVLVRLDQGTLIEQINAAKANLEVAKRRREVTERLAKENFSAPLEQAERAAAFAVAKSKLRQLQQQLADTVVVAPVSGHLETLHIEKGERVSRDMAIATIMGLDILSVVVAVPQSEVARIKIGRNVLVTFAGNGSRKGLVKKIAAKSNSETRTFDVKIELPNKDRKLRAGMSVEAIINAGTTQAFSMSPAHLSVSGDGALTAKIVVKGKVVMVPIDMIQSGEEMVFVSGLPNEAILLTVGQGFVEDGDKVVYKLTDAS